MHGLRQLERARALYEQAAEILPTSLALRHSYANFNRVSVGSPHVMHTLPWDDLHGASTCPGTVGGGFLAGDEEGAPVELAAEGKIRNRFVQDAGAWRMLNYSFLELSGAQAALGLFWPVAALTLSTDQHDACHKEKVSLLPVGEVSCAERAVPGSSSASPAPNRAPNIVQLARLPSAARGALTGLSAEGHRASAPTAHESP